ncbi:MAG: acyl carrier protein [Magnetococcales bacterium]|nr:acyl carrier protein [Magnetococcales bacterium]
MAHDFASVLATFRSLVTPIFFIDDPETITPETTAADVEGWDSLSHTLVVMAVEREFGIRFSVNDTVFENVGEMVNGILARLPGDR